MSNTIVKNNQRASVLSYPVDLMRMEDAVNFTENCINSSTGIHVLTLNPEMIMQGLKNTQLSDTLKQAELIIPDGVGIKVAMFKLGIKIEQLPGIEYSEKLIQRCAEKGYSVGFLGASRDVVTEAADKWKSRYPSLNITFIHDGFFNEENESEIINQLQTSKPQVLFVALGVPKQEFWITKYKNVLNSTIMVGVGGSFDVWADKVKRAPEGFRKLGCEWFYRLISQPSRFRRMFPTLPLFFIKVLLDSKNTRKEY